MIRFVSRVACAAPPTFGGEPYRVRAKTVQQLMREIIHASRAWPAGPEDAKNRARKIMAANAHLTNPYDISKAVGQGRWMVSQMHEVARLKRYREMKKRYGSDAEHEQGQGS
jgi:hypothetical protein